MINFQEVARKPNEIKAMTGYTLEEFNALLSVFDEAAAESDRTLEGKKRENRPAVYKNSVFSSISDRLFLF
ncbi:MAG: hypothetical protein D3923_02230 [Candidatus Electrothrix sp. AR3]|nr:hypothetical protein [Candidatus Electrothrix sp. AR3]